ncbi:MAG: glucosaminidase domain-containing protein [Bacteroidota bacterium]
MEQWFTSQQVKNYISANWFKIVLFMMIAFVFLRKDFSFSINLNSPMQPEEQEQMHNNPSQKAAKKKDPMITRKMPDKAVAKTQTSFFDRFPFIGKEKKVAKPKSELATISEDVKQAYIKRFSHVAAVEQEKYGVPASITIANALFHSFAGKRDMAIAGNNHFAIPCTSNWLGDSNTYQDACYRHYENAWSSFRDHSLYVTQGKFKGLRKLGPKDYKSWAYGLEKRGFSDRSNLAASLIELIESYDLQQFDN